MTNELRPKEVAGEAPRYARVAEAEQIASGYLEYLHDESRMAAASIEVLHFPETPEQVGRAVRAARDAEHRVTVSGARTGITGAAVPLDAEEIISLERMKARPIVRPDGKGGWTATVAAGTTLAEMADALDHGLCEYPDGKPERPLFYPVDSTEASAHLGGTIATNASGARTLFYGPTRDWVLALKVVTADGRLLDLARGEVTARDGVLRYALVDGTERTVLTPDVPTPQTKHTAGYHLRADMDAVDLFVGSEGTLGIVAGATLRLAEKPENRLFLTQFVDDAKAAVQLVLACKRHPDLQPLALEYIGPGAVALLREKGKQTPAYLEVSRLPEDARALVYAEIAFWDEAHLDAIYAALTDVLDEVRLDGAHSWAGFTEKDMTQMKRLRHAVPETVNAIIAQRRAQVADLHKVGTDMAVPDEGIEAMLDFYARRLREEGMQHVIFGHLGSGHVHVNILPERSDDIVRAEALYGEFAREAVRLGGSVAAEHGIGRIKRQFLAVQYSPEHLQAMKAVKEALDPDGILNPGVLFTD